VIRRLVGAALLIAAAGVWLGLAVPAQRERDLARSEYARAREDRERVRAQAVVAERRGAAGRTPQAGAATARALRASLLEATRGLPVGAVRLSAASAPGRVAAHGRLSAEGRMADVVSLAERLAGPDSGVLVERVDLAAARGEIGPGVRLDIEVSSVRAGS
jgi:hypothetical protein